MNNQKINKLVKNLQNKITHIESLENHKTVLQQLLEFFYYNQYKYKYYPYYDMLEECDYYGNRYKVIYKVN
tara:strand:+ start:469 stop:681 length:213 start_codon:yes stop_codon:yes gene_type:complete